MTTQLHGSRRHILDMLGRPDYPAPLQALLARWGVTLTPDDKRQPAGSSQPEECELPGFLRSYCADIMPGGSAVFDGWWVKHGGKLPTWDLVSTCGLQRERGVLLLEAKAHEGEFGWPGKSLPGEGEKRSRENHEAIRRSINDVRNAMRREADPGVNISIDTHYQLSNRVAWAWKLAECGIPTVLLYLGFIGDTYFRDPFVDSEQWQRIMGGYLQGVVPQRIVGRPIAAGNKGGSFMMLVGPLPIPSLASTVQPGSHSVYLPKT